MSYSMVGAGVGLTLVILGVVVAFRVKSRRFEIIAFFVGLFAIPTYFGDLVDRQSAKLREAQAAQEAETRTEQRFEKLSKELRDASAELLEAAFKKYPNEITRRRTVASALNRYNSAASQLGVAQAPLDVNSVLEFKKHIDNPTQNELRKAIGSADIPEAAASRKPVSTPLQDKVEEETQPSPPPPTAVVVVPPPVVPPPMAPPPF